MFPSREPIQIGKELGTGQTPVTGEHAVGTLPAHRQAGPFQMAHGHLQNRILGAVVNGQTHVNFRDLDIAHDSLAGDVQQPFVFGLLFLGEDIAVVPAQQLPVIGPGGFPEGIIAGVIQGGHVFGVGGNGLGLVEGIPVVTGGGVQQQGQPYKQYEK